MGRRLFALGMLLWAPAVWAQCQPTNSPTYDFSNSKTVNPNQVPFAAVTLWMTDNNGNNASHVVTVGTNTLVVINVQGYNAATVALYYTINNGSQQTWIPPQSTLYAQVGFIAYSSWVGSVLHLKAVATEKSGSGSFTSTTQDVGSIIVTNQAAGIYSADQRPSNSYLMVSLDYNGTPNIPYQTTCPNASEKDMIPTAQLNLSNTTSGENRNGVSFQGATTVVGQPVSATAYDYISFLPSVDGFPGDIIVTGAGGFVYCSAIGDFWQGFKDFQATIEAALTFSQVTGFVGQNASLRNWCLLADIPPDYNPNILLNAQPGATYAWGAALCLNSTWSSGFWLCTPGVSYSLTGTYTRKPCTHNPPPY